MPACARRTRALARASSEIWPWLLLTPHDLTPVGDLVWYVSTNLSHLTGRPGAEHHHPHVHAGIPYPSGGQPFLFGGVEVPATKPEPLDCQVFGELLKLF